ncbi:hypothetical protein E3Q23_02571 [Wallemia mellicola]|uniref:BZIP domain-containing protein n=1 Tax=Wallemia mellicola TaxID=1708541 RepID=A0A4T0QSV1_9BASI|nr:hypothetical protein E3Q23_02571 [Wallemia mellicola]TIB99558.1 hypothetical protein E3Q17_02556 [Wallemia mellicola]TIC10630.1 hypothetical protein E3Q14_02703 [Wallemia mellicola]TIC27158.1 hypothetical protein E3Q11_02668 [Wallemia mellicola]TIC29611.1 hypothetical protein E3Q10_02527 [Wallemia mellicola]
MDSQFLDMLREQINSYNSKDSINPLDLSNNRQPFGQFTSNYKENPTPPLTNNDTSSPESSGSHNNYKLEDKRKATDESFDQDMKPHNIKNPNTDRRSSGSSNDNPSSKSSKQNSSQKRKEQNRAAQRAFRERKEKHVKVLEDKVAQQEEENNNLRDLLSRLQQENMTLKQSAFTFQFPVPSQQAGQQDKPNKSLQKSPSPLPQISNNLEYRDSNILDNNPISDFNNFSGGDWDDILNDINFQGDFIVDQQPIPSPKPAESTLGPPPTIIELAQVLASPSERSKCPQVKAKMEQMGIVQNEHEDIEKIGPYLIQEIKKVVKEIAEENKESVDEVVRQAWKDLGKDQHQIKDEAFDLDNLCSELRSKATCGVSNAECQAKFLSALAQRQNKTTATS